MRNRWLGVAVSGVLAIGGMTCSAAEAGEAVLPPAHGGAPVNRGGGGAAPAPAPRPAPPPRQPSPGSGAAPNRPATPPAQKPSQATPATPGGARDANGQPIDAAKRNHDDDQKKDKHRHHRFPKFRIPPTLRFGWAPYTFWSGTSYWSPPLDGYADDGYSDDDSTQADSTPTTPAIPPDTSTPTKEQAKALNELEANPDYRAAVAELKQAESDYAAASARVIDQLKKDQHYQALVAERDQAKDRVEAVREAAQASAKIPSADAVTAAAQRKLEVKSEITRMKQQAIAADPQARAAKAKVSELSARVMAMRQQARGAGAQ